MNRVERFFRDRTDKSIRRGVFRNGDDLHRAIDENISAHNINPKPFVRTAAASDILAKVRRGRERLIK